MKNFELADIFEDWNFYSMIKKNDDGAILFNKQNMDEILFPDYNTRLFDYDSEIDGEKYINKKQLYECLFSSRSKEAIKFKLRLFEQIEEKLAAVDECLLQYLEGREFLNIYDECDIMEIINIIFDDYSDYEPEYDPFARPYAELGENLKDSSISSYMLLELMFILGTDRPKKLDQLLEEILSE
jgi:hypothetical protein